LTEPDGCALIWESAMVVLAGLKQNKGIQMFLTAEYSGVAYLGLLFGRSMNGVEFAGL